MSSPAEIIRQFLIDREAGSNPLDAEDWPVFVSFLPSSPDNAICVYDTMGQLDGRIMTTGEQVTHPGVQIYTRGLNYPAVWDKIQAIASALDLQRASIVATDINHSYKLQNVSRTSDVLSLGIEQEGDRRRYQVVINALLTYYPL